MSEVDVEEQKDELRAELYFAQVPVWILFHKELQHSDVRVWAVLQRYAGDRWVCWPGHAAIAEHACISKRQVQSCIQRLCAVGALSVERRKKQVEKDGEIVVQNNTNVYTLKIVPPSMRPVSTIVVLPEEGSVARSDDPADGGLGGAGGEATVAIGVATVATGGIATVSLKREPYTNSNSTSISSSGDSASSSEIPATQSAAAKKKPRAKKKSGTEVVPVRDDVELLCNTLEHYLISNGVRKTKTKVTESWRTEARRLLDTDGIPLEEAMRILEWSQEDEFWKGIILSMKKFRDKFDQLRIRSNAVSPKQAEARVMVDRLRAMAAEAERIDKAPLELEEGDDGAI